MVPAAGVGLGGDHQRLDGVFVAVELGQHGRLLQAERVPLGGRDGQVRPGDGQALFDPGRFVADLLGDLGGAEAGHGELLVGAGLVGGGQVEAVGVLHDHRHHRCGGVGRGQVGADDARHAALAGDDGGRVAAVAGDDAMAAVAVGDHHQRLQDPAGGDGRGQGIEITQVGADVVGVGGQRQGVEVDEGRDRDGGVGGRLGVVVVGPRRPSLRRSCSLGCAPFWLGGVPAWEPPEHRAKLDGVSASALAARRQNSVGSLSSRASQRASWRPLVSGPKRR